MNSTHFGQAVHGSELLTAEAELDKERSKATNRLFMHCRQPLTMLPPISRTSDKQSLVRFRDEVG